MVARAGAGFFVGVNLPAFTIFCAMVKQALNTAHTTGAIYDCFLGTEHCGGAKPFLGQFSGLDTGFAPALATFLAEDGLILNGIIHLSVQFTFQLGRSGNHRNIGLTMG